MDRHKLQRDMQYAIKPRRQKSIVNFTVFGRIFSQRSSCAIFIYPFRNPQFRLLIIPSFGPMTTSIKS